jgi:hypothetical protein
MARGGILRPDPAAAYDSAVSSVHSVPAQSDHDVEPIVRGVSGLLPGRLGDLLATLVIIVTFGLFVWSLIATWSGAPGNALPLFQVLVVGTILGPVALYARKTFSYVYALIASALWLWVSIVPFVPVVQLILQAVLVTLIVVGVNIALAAVTYNKRRYSYAA